MLKNLGTVGPCPVCKKKAPPGTSSSGHPNRLYQCTQCGDVRCYSCHTSVNGSCPVCKKL